MLCALFILVAGAAPEQAFKPSFDLGLVAHLNYEVPLSDDKPGATSAGDVALIAKAQINPTVGLLSETLLGVHQGQPMVRIPRLYAHWSPAPNVELRVGKVHAPLGYYTLAHPQQGYLYQVSIRRPRLISMEYNESVLPQQLTGVRASWQHQGKAGLRLYASVGQDPNFSPGNKVPRGIAANVSFEPAAADGLNVGVSGYYDVVDPARSTVGPHRSDTHDEEQPHGEAAPADLHQDSGKHGEAVLIVHAHWERYPLSLTGEAWHMEHVSVDGHGGESEYHRLLGGFVQAAFMRGGFTLYGRHEQFQRAADDQVYNVLLAPIKWNATLGGVRWTADPRLVFKAEFEYRHHDSSALLSTQMAMGF